jgi:hypothetical protein
MCDAGPPAHLSESPARTWSLSEQSSISTIGGGDRTGDVPGESIRATQRGGRARVMPELVPFFSVPT